MNKERTEEEKEDKLKEEDYEIDQEALDRLEKLREADPFIYD